MRCLRSWLQCVSRLRSFHCHQVRSKRERHLPFAARFARHRLTTCIKLIMASVRYERFCDGHLGEVIKSGHIAAILRRLEQLADAHLETTKVVFVDLPR